MGDYGIQRKLIAWNGYWWVVLTEFAGHCLLHYITIHLWRLRQTSRPTCIFAMRHDCAHRASAPASVRSPVRPSQRTDVRPWNARLGCLTGGPLACQHHNHYHHHNHHYNPCHNTMRSFSSLVNLLLSTCHRSRWYIWLFYMHLWYDSIVVLCALEFSP